MKFQQSFKVLGLCVAAAALLVLFASSQEAAAHPSLGKLLAEAGLGGSDAKGPVTEEQTRLVQLISGVYADEDELRSREIALMNEVGQSRPDGRQKGELGAIANKHLANNFRLAELVKALKAASEEANRGASESAPAPAA